MGQNQDPGLEQQGRDATGENSREIAEKLNPEAGQLYMEAVMPLRAGASAVIFLRSDVISYYGVKSTKINKNGANGTTFSRKAGTRSDYSGATDGTAKSVPFAATEVGNGTRIGNWGRGKPVWLWLPKGTEDKNLRQVSFRVPSKASAIEVGNWIKTCFSEKTPNAFRMGRTRYNVEGVAAGFGKLKAFAKSKANP